jgi:serine protease Do
MTDSGKVEVGDIVLAVETPLESVKPLPRESSAPPGVAALDWIMKTSYRPTRRSIPEIPAALVDTEDVGGNQYSHPEPQRRHQGIRFAIPTDLTRDVMESLVKDGQVTRGYMGVLIQDLNPALKKQFDLRKAPPGAGG